MDRAPETLIPTNHGAKSAAEIVGDLTYINYAFNRQRSPQISPERWALIYPRAAELEEHYQEEAPRCDNCEAISHERRHFFTGGRARDYCVACHDAREEEA